MKPSLFLHSCCAPCLTSVYEKLQDSFRVTVFWYNPNIFPKEEFDKRLNCLVDYCNKQKINLVISKTNYVEEHLNWIKKIKGLEKDKEKGRRCNVCFEFRLDVTGKVAKIYGADFFGTELSVSPHKDAEAINKIGQKISTNLNIQFLSSDFKKEDGFVKSVELSKKHGLYRQNYCGCEFSKQVSKSS